MIFFENWAEIFRIVISSIAVYIAVVFFIRTSGKRSTSKMNNFDWIVTVAMGSMVGSSILLKDVTVLDGLVGIVMLLGLQFIATKLSVVWSPITDVLHAQPRIVFWQGEFLQKNMRLERVNHHEILSAIRESGYHSLKQVAVVILESNGELSVLAQNSDAQISTLADVITEPDVKQNVSDRRVSLVF
ncbi:MAG: DUF421 domain-containing protein [Leptolyngbyaceae cyanobacterium SL_1_1]|nr:DUF421 domain-containing protein [Leptolyngbyaceae cyanobacterium RM1_1_2]NJO11648.1 DUF421 domain-containing protein [Leptolyngbyaceae cyanobacterium SL_1_1]